MMRVITGSARGRRLETLAGADVTRPTAESVKEALFSMIQFQIEGKRALDLFAGSGQLGIEALSRGASFCTFVEADKNAVAVVKRNIEKCGFSASSAVVHSDSLSYVRRCAEFDLAFLDPPYGRGMLQAVLPQLERFAAPGAVVVCESSRDDGLLPSYGSLVMFRERSYGKTKLTLYRKE